MSTFPIDLLHNRHNRRDFASGSYPLDHYFQHLARQDVRRDLAAVYVMHDPGTSLVVGYYTLCAAGLPVEQLPPDIADRLPHYPAFPAVLLGRLAVDARYQGRGFGGELMLDATRRILRLSNDIGIAFVIVDAIDDNARRFYERFGFRPVLDGGRRLFLSMTSAEKLVGMFR